MSEPASSTARPVRKGRLRDGFTAAASADLPEAPTLPPRPRQKAKERPLGDVASGPVPMTPPATAEPPAPVEDPSRDAETSTGQRRRRGRPPKAPQDRTPTEQAGVLVPTWLIERIQHERAATGGTNATVIMRAIDTVHPDLARLVAESLPPASSGSLFAATPPTPRRLPGPTTQLSFRIAPADLAVIDRLVTDCSAGTRSHLIGVALSAYFAS